MRTGIIANLLEKLVLATGRVPTPVIEAFPPLLASRAIMAATKLNIFEALAGGCRTASQIACACRTQPQATAKLLGALVGMRYLTRDGDRYALAPVARRWLLASSPNSVRDYLLYNYTQWDWIARLEHYVTCGQPVCFHQEMTDAQWERYQRAMLCIARLSAPEVARRAPIPRHAGALLDIGGAHGYYAAALCRQHPGMRAVILDLPEAVAHAAPLLADDMRQRVQYWPGDALTADLGQARYDVIFMANLAHHFDAATNRTLAGRIARALRPGGVCIIQDGMRPTGRACAQQFAALGDLYFALSSEAGLYSFADMQCWQRAAGLVPLKPIRLITGPGQGMQAARKPQ